MIKMYTRVLTAALFIIAQLKITQISVNRKTEKQIVEYSNNGLLSMYVTNGRISETLSWAKETRHKRTYRAGFHLYVALKIAAQKKDHKRLKDQINSLN